MFLVSHLFLFLSAFISSRGNELMVEYAGLLGRACPAAVYEYADAEGSEADAAGKKFVINSQNCIHVRLFSPPRNMNTDK
jgi:hypothetical protein